MTRLTLGLTMVLTLVFAAPAAAKEVVFAKVCGASGCREVEDKKSLLALHEGGSPTDPPGKASDFYRAEMEVRGEGREIVTFEIALVPRARVIAQRTMTARSRGWRSPTPPLPGTGGWPAASSR